MMNVQNPYVALAPVILLAVAAVVGLVIISLRRNHATIFALTIMSLATALAGLVAIWRTALHSKLVEASGRIVGTAFSSALPVKIGTLFIIDSYSLFFIALTFAAAGAVAMMSYGYLEKRGQRKEEYYILLLLATLGAAAMAASTAAEATCSWARRARSSGCCSRAVSISVARSPGISASRLSRSR